MIILKKDFRKNVDLAKFKAKKMVSNGLYSRFNLSLTGRIDKAFIGCLGEIGFEEYLISKNIVYKKDDSDFTLTNSDEFDFLVNGKKVDIKVAKKSTKSNPSDFWTYGYPQEQNPRSKDYVVIGWIDFENQQIGFYGWTEGYKIEKFKVVERNTYAGYKYLTPNHEFKWGILNKDFNNF